MPGFTQIPNDEVFDDPLWTADKFTKGQALIDLYKLAQFKDGLVIKRGITIQLKPGQVGWSMESLRKRWGWGIGKVRRFLNTLELTGHIELQKTNVSTTITLLHWIPNGTPNKHANGTQTVSQTESKRYPNNIVNTENTVNIENTPKVDVDFENSIEKLWSAWIGDSELLPTNAEKKIITNALKYNPDTDGFWLPLLSKRKKILKVGGNSPSNMKYWFDAGFREMRIKVNSRAHIQEGHLEKDYGW